MTPTLTPGPLSAWRWFPWLTLLLFLAPVIAGLLATILPALGYLPALGSHSFSAAALVTLISQPGLTTSVLLTITIGLTATLLSVFAAFGTMAMFDGTRLSWIRAALAPLLSTPHAAMAIGLAFLIAPSGWLVRLFSPWATGWTSPPDVATVGHTSGAAVILGLVLKEVPYLMLMIAAALQQVPAQGQMQLARALGYSRATAWYKVLLPLLYPQIRLPVFAVLAYSLSVVDVSLVLGPGSPPPLAVLALRWLTDPDLKMVFPGSAAALLQLCVVVLAILGWYGAERLAARCGRFWLYDGQRRGVSEIVAALGAALTCGLLLAAFLSVLTMALWSFSAQWRFPSAWPEVMTLANWGRRSDGILMLSITTVLIAMASVALALVLTLGCLEAEDRTGRRAGAGALWLIYVPLLVPQIAFLFGAQVALLRLQIDGTWLAVVWAHLLFVLPYVFLSLADPWRVLDRRLAHTAASLGASPMRILWRIKLPLLLRPILIAGAVGFAVSVGQYLSTVFAGNGRVATLTTEAITLSSGADRRLMGVYTFVQAALPVAVYALALWLPKWRYRRFKGMQIDA